MCFLCVIMPHGLVNLLNIWVTGFLLQLPVYKTEETCSLMSHYFHGNSYFPPSLSFFLYLKGLCLILYHMHEIVLSSPYLKLTGWNSLSDSWPFWVWSCKWAQTVQLWTVSSFENGGHRMSVVRSHSLYFVTSWFDLLRVISSPQCQICRFHRNV